MLFLMALIPATALTVGGYVALFLSHRSEGGLKAFGRYLGIWAFVLAGLVVLGGMFAAGHMHRSHGGMWDGPEGRYCPFMERRGDDRPWDRREHGEPGAAPEAPPTAPPGPQAPGGPSNPPPTPNR
ncbi:MAG TPA: hypothetical protein VEU78_05595 [Steroidobacteraceae bacterium]|nr:hypothetical protein [Steroidobacteraceae bacterium]